MPRGKVNNPSGKNQYSVGGIKRKISSKWKGLKRRVGNIETSRTTQSGGVYAAGRYFKSDTEVTIKRLNGRTDRYVNGKLIQPNRKARSKRK